MTSSQKVATWEAFLRSISRQDHSRKSHDLGSAGGLNRGHLEAKAFRSILSEILNKVVSSSSSST